MVLKCVWVTGVVCLLWVLFRIVSLFAVFCNTVR